MAAPNHEAFLAYLAVLDAAAGPVELRILTPGEGLPLDHHPIVEVCGTPDMEEATPRPGAITDDDTGTD